MADGEALVNDAASAETLAHAAMVDAPEALRLVADEALAVAAVSVAVEVTLLVTEADTLPVGPLTPVDNDETEYGLYQEGPGCGGE